MSTTQKSYQVFHMPRKSNNIYNNLTLQLIVEGSKTTSSSCMSNSINYICYKYGTSKYDLSNVQVTDVMKHLFSTNIDTLMCADVIIDMLSFIDQNKFDILTPTQRRELLTFACTIYPGCVLLL